MGGKDKRKGADVHAWNASDPSLCETTPPRIPTQAAIELEWVHFEGAGRR